MTTSRMTFDSPEFKNAIEGLSGRAANSNTSQQRMSFAPTTSNTSVNTNTSNTVRNASEAERQGYANSNEAIANNPMFQQSVVNDARNFTEDVRRFNAGLDFKNTADQRANDTQRLGYNNQLEGVKYNADAGVKSTQIGADAQVKTASIGADASRYGADKAAQASMYGADKGYLASIYGADRGVDAARIGADASRFNALLGAGTTFFNSSQYRPTFNR